jgi:hypothetical protein
MERIFVVVIAMLRRCMKKFISYHNNKYGKGKHCHDAYSKNSTT